MCPRPQIISSAVFLIKKMVLYAILKEFTDLTSSLVHRQLSTNVCVFAVQLLKRVIIIIH
jgi:hypothetical protein